MITLLTPIWLLLALPLGLSLWVWRMPTRVLTVMRIITVALVLAGLASVAVRLPSRSGTVIVVADRSLSMPGEAGRSELESIGLVHKKLRGNDQLGVVTFGRIAATEQAPQTSVLSAFANDVGDDASNLHDAIDRALSLIPPDGPGRVLVLSDGRWTGKDPSAGAARAAARGVGIDYRSIERPATSDLAIASIDAPMSVNPREVYMITAWVQAPVPQQITYELRRGDRSIAAGRRTVPAGLTRLTFRDAVDEPSTAVYSLHVQGDGLDPVPENNTARLLVGVEGPKPMILVTEKTESGLARLLRAGGLDVQAIKPDEAKWELEDLSSYSSVMIEDVPAGRIGLAGMNNLAAWVKDTGAGLMLSGGQTSYGPGGYFKSPLDPIMPVSMELRREHRKLSIAIVIAMDRSGSMAMTVPGGRTKMDLADLAAVQVVDMLTPMDELGVLAVDSESHEISPLAPLSDPQAVRNRILRIESMGGGIYIYEALSHAADLLQKAQAGTKHIILFADAADSEEPGKYEELLAYARKAGMTCSVIGLGTPHDSDADLLRDIARRGDGRIFFTENPEELPRLFAQDTFVVARSSFIEDPTPIKLTPGLTTLTGVIYSDAPPNIGGYNLTYLRDGANLSVVTTDEYAAPVVASWNAGDGRVLCYTGQIDGKFTGPITKWLKLGDTLTGLARWTAGESRGLGDNMLLTQQVHEGIATVSLHLDPQRTTNALAHLPEVTILRGTAGEKPRADRTNMTWTSPDTLSVDFDLRGRETAIATVNLADHPPIAMPPVTLPYSPEFKPAGTDRGAAALRRLAAATGGVERVDLGGIWDDLPRLPRLVDLSPYIFSAALGIFLLEILERRTGAIALLLTRRPRHRVVMKDEPEPAAKARPMRPRRVAAESVVQAKPQTPADSSAAAAPAPPPVEPEPTGSVLDALGQARRRARDRTDRSE